MEVRVSFKDMEPSPAVRNFTLAKTEKLAKFFRGRIQVSWHFSVERERQVAHCHIVGKNIDYFGQAETTDLYASIDEVVAQIERQLRKHKEIVKDRLHSSANNKRRAS